MSYIGRQPTAAALTASDITDGIISTAKIAADAVTVPKLDDSIDHINFKNRLINGDMAVAQRGTTITAPNDDTYHLDRWLIVSDGNDAVDITQSSTAPTNQLYSCALDVETEDKKFGIVQFIENKNCTGLIGQTATLSFKAKASAVDKLDNVKCAIISWSSTADSVTSDIVSAWGAEGTNPTLASNLTYENTPANLNVTTSWVTYSVSAAIDTSSTTNVAVFIWSDVTDTTAGQFLYITDVQLEVAAAASDFEFLPYDVNLRRCQRYCYVVNGVVSDETTLAASGFATSTSNLKISISSPVPLRAYPSVSEAGLQGNVVGGAEPVSLNTVQDNGNTTFSPNDVVVNLIPDSGTPFTAGQSLLLRLGNSTSDNLKLDAEL